MANNRNKKVQKLRRYRDKLLVTQCNLEATIREYKEVFSQIIRAASGDKLLRVIALASDKRDSPEMEVFVLKDDIIKELTLVYRMLAVERRYSADIQVAAKQRDYLRVAALSADHQAESIAHDKMLTEWSRDHGFTRSLRKEMEDEIVV